MITSFMYFADCAPACLSKYSACIISTAARTESKKLFHRTTQHLHCRSLELFEPSRIQRDLCNVTPKSLISWHHLCISTPGKHTKNVTTYRQLGSLIGTLGQLEIQLEIARHYASIFGQIELHHPHNYRTCSYPFPMPCGTRGNKQTNNTNGKFFSAQKSHIELRPHTSYFCHWFA